MTSNYFNSMLRPKLKILDINLDLVESILVFLPAGFMKFICKEFYKKRYAELSFAELFELGISNIKFFYWWLPQEYLCKYAIIENNFPIFIWLDSIGCNYDMSNILAYKYGNIDILEYVYQTRENVHFAKCQNGNVEITRNVFGESVVVMSEHNLIPFQLWFRKYGVVTSEWLAARNINLHMGLEMLTLILKYCTIETFNWFIQCNYDSLEYCDKLILMCLIGNLEVVSDILVNELGSDYDEYIDTDDIANMVYSTIISQNEDLIRFVALHVQEYQFDYVQLDATDMSILNKISPMGLAFWKKYHPRHTTIHSAFPDYFCFLIENLADLINFFESGIALSDYVTNHIMKFNNFEMVEYTISHGAGCDFETTCLACEICDFEIFRFLVQNGASLTNSDGDSVIMLALKKDLRYLQCVLNAGLTLDYQCKDALFEGQNIEMIEYVENLGFVFGFELISTPVTSFKFLKYLIDKGHVISSENVEIMFRDGKMNYILYMLTNSFEFQLRFRNEFQNRAIQIVARNGHARLLKYLIKIRCDIFGNELLAAVEARSLQCIEIILMVPTFRDRHIIIEAIKLAEKLEYTECKDYLANFNIKLDEICLR